MVQWFSGSVVQWFRCSVVQLFVVQWFSGSVVQILNKRVRNILNFTFFYRSRWFWQIMNELPLEQQKHFLLFTTGSDRIPVGGMGEMPFKISCWRGRTNMLPQAHTCFNQLVLPPYPDKETLKAKLLIAINNAEGFGLE
ncbi:putative E3 ubiquitin-protein ligase HUL4 [Armadillidium vulgare]|nr:putative E3 ubiquitin-protein ligase HUL4 [Armadillidium vulgare]